MEINNFFVSILYVTFQRYCRESFMIKHSNVYYYVTIFIESDLKLHLKQVEPAISFMCYRFTYFRKTGIVKEIRTMEYLKVYTTAEINVCYMQIVESSMLHKTRYFLTVEHLA